MPSVNITLSKHYLFDFWEWKRGRRSHDRKEETDQRVKDPDQKEGDLGLRP